MSRTYVRQKGETMVKKKAPEPCDTWDRVQWVRVETEGAWKGSILGGYFGTQINFSACPTLWIIRLAWEAGLDLSEAVPMSSTGDWSFIRDADPHEREAALALALSFLGYVVANTPREVQRAASDAALAAYAPPGSKGAGAPLPADETRVPR